MIITHSRKKIEKIFKNICPILINDKSASFVDYLNYLFDYIKEKQPDIESTKKIHPNRTLFVDHKFDIEYLTKIYYYLDFMTKDDLFEDEIFNFTLDEFNQIIEATHYTKYIVYVVNSYLNDEDKISNSDICLLTSSLNKKYLDKKKDILDYYEVIEIDDSYSYYDYDDDIPF